MYALVVEVSIAADRAEAAERLLNEEVVPTVAAQEGLVSAYWLRSADKTSGRAIAFYESEAAAKAAVGPEPAPPAPPESPVQLGSYEIFEVVATV